MLQESENVTNLLRTVIPRNLSRYHIYFDNYFTSLDLLIHLKKIELCATGTVRENRIAVKNNVSKKDERRSYDVMHEKNSDLNFITVVDSKTVSLLSTTAVTPLVSVKQKAIKKKDNLFFSKRILSL